MISAKAFGGTLAKAIVAPAATAGCFAYSKSVTFCDSERNGTATRAAAALRRNAATDSGRLKKRMTSIGRFSLRSETKGNPSIPTMFVALVGPAAADKTDSWTTFDDDCDNSSIGGERLESGMTSSEFKSLWEERNINVKHERFQSRVSPDDDRFFEPSKTTLEDHVNETLHFYIYRNELKKRIEQMLTQTLDVTKKLWEANISSGKLGSSGAVSKAKVEALKEANNQASLDYDEHETVIIFRSHHALADGVSLNSAMVDLSDEAEELNNLAEEQMRMFLQKRKSSLLQRIHRFLHRLIGYWIIGSVRALINHGYLLLVSTSPFHPFVAAAYCGVEKEGKNETMNYIGSSTRSVSWCDAAPVADVKRVARALYPGATVNDVFVTCVTHAIVKQLREHCRTSSLEKSVQTLKSLPSNINIVIPVHLYGGIVPPGESLGNRIGATVARVPVNSADYSNKFSLDGTVAATTVSHQLEKVSKSLSATKTTPAATIGYYMAKFCSDYMPQDITKYLMTKANANASVVVTNVRGPTKKIHWNGRTVESMGGFVPLPPGVPVGVVVQSYAGMISLSITADRNAVPDGDLFLSWVLEEYRRLCLAAKVKMENEKR